VDIEKRPGNPESSSVFVITHNLQNEVMHAIVRQLQTNLSAFDSHQVHRFAGTRRRRQQNVQIQAEKYCWLDCNTLLIGE
jgi:hypothetical protein